MILRPPQPSELLHEVERRVECSAAAVSFIDMRSHVEKYCHPHDALTWKPSFAKSLLRKLAPLPRGRIDALEKVMALCIAARAPVAMPRLALLLEAQSMLMMFDERWDNVKGAPSKGGKALQRKYDPAREHARHLAAEIWRKNPTLAATKVVRMIENDFVAAAETRCFEVSIEPCSLRRSLKTWITKDSPLP